jgi:hypothetical protein
LTSEDQDFYAAIPVIDSFADVMKPSSYRPLPEGWAVGFADVVGSTKAIAQGRYKAVNMVGAGVIASVANALDRFKQGCRRVCAPAKIAKATYEDRDCGCVMHGREGVRIHPGITHSIGRSSATCVEARRTRSRIIRQVPL